MVRIVWCVVVSLLLLFPAAGSAAVSIMKKSMDSMFVTIKQDFDSIAASPIVKKKPVAPVDGYFFTALKAHQPYYSLVRTDSKGVVVNEVIRLVEKPSTKKQNVSKEPWFRYVSTRQAPYHWFMKIEETGRYYLFWAAPIIDKSQKGKEAFQGAVALKIDLWDCFCDFSKNVETPFLIRVNKMRLYSNKWKDSIAYREELLSVPGVKKISVRRPKVIAPVAAPAVASVAPAPAVDSSRIKATADSLKAAKGKHMKKRSRANVVGGIALLLIVLIILLGYVIPTIRNRIIMGKIERKNGPTI